MIKIQGINQAKPYSIFIDRYNKNPNLRNLLDVSERIDKRGEWQFQIPFRNIIYTKNNENIINFEHIS